MSLAGPGASRNIQRSRNVVSRVVADEAIVVPIRRGAADMDSIYTFNESGTALWAMVENSRSIADMATHLQSEYGLSAEDAVADTQKFIAELTEAGLIELE
ncbi:MAG TPA: PqqD family protein [Candidatus Acidoferrales bacterium]|nr:PqqD family protein [Candidatus Acidoferrales bacterium]